jgi:hypothetical protein
MAHLNDEIGLSEMGRERKRWDLPQRDGGMRPDRFEEYPKMLYRAVEVNGQIVDDDPQDCQTLASSADHEARLKAEGWAETVQEARDAAERQATDVANAAAERHLSDQRLSASARAEAAAADAASGSHLPEIPEQPVRRKRGRPRKVQPA